MTADQLNDPVWLANNADEGRPFEMACAAVLRRQQAQIEQLKAVLLKHIALYRVSGEHWNPRAETQRIYANEMGIHA